MGDLLRLAREFQEKVAAEKAEAAESAKAGPYNPYLAVLTRDEFAPAPPRFEADDEVEEEQLDEEEDEEDTEPDIAASRQMTDDEATSLKELLKPHLRLNNVSCAFQAEADADDFLNFAADLVNDREPLGGILDQLAELELEICDMDAMDGIEATLEEFLVRMDGGKKDWREERAAREAAARKPQSLEEELLNSESHVSVDLSAKTNAAKYRQEMEGLFGAKRGSLKSRMAMYDESGKIIKQNKQDEEDMDEGPKEKSADQQRREELTAVMNDRSLSKTERSQRMEEVRAKYPDHGGKATTVAVQDSTRVETKSLLDASVESGGAPKVGGVDLSSKNVAEKRRLEMAKMFGGGGGKGKGLKSRMGMYDETGKIIKGAAEEEEEVDEGPRGKSVDQLRREEMMAVMKDKGLSKDEKAQKMEDIKLKYSEGPEAVMNGSALAGASSSGDIAGLDGSTKSFKAEEAAHQQLTAEETESLTASLKSHLRLNNVSCAFQADADAEDFLNYAIDLVNDGEPLDKILEDLADMELEICDDDVLRGIGDTLEDFLVQRNGGKKNWREERAARAAAANKPQSLEAELLHSESHQRVDLSAKTAAAKSKREMDALFGGGKRGSLKSRMGMYDESGKIIKQSTQEEEEFDEGPKEKSVDQLRREEMMLVMKDKSLSKDEKALKMEEIKLKYDDGTATSASTNGANARMSPSARSGGLDVPAKSEESAPNPLTDDEAESLAVLLRPHLKLNNVSWVDADRDAENMLNCAIDSVNDGEHVDKILENLAEMEMKICDDEALENIGHSLEGFLKKSTQKKWREERAAREAAANKPLSLEEQLLNSENHVSIDLSAKKYGAKGRQEMAGLFGAGGGLKSRMGMYDETGKIIKSSKTEDDVVDEGPKEKTVDQLRREEMMAVMKDRSLSKDEKAQKMEEIKLKYDDGPAPGSETASGAPAAGATGGGSLDISTKSEESAPRPLSDEETETLTGLLRPHLKLNNVACALDAEADAEDFLNYAVDLVNEGEPLDKITENLADMELEICDDDALENIRDTLEDFLVRRSGGKKNWREERAARAAASNKPQSLEAELLHSESHVSVDLSAKTNATKYRQEKEALFGGGKGKGLKSRMGMYDESGKIIKQSKHEEEEVDTGPKEKTPDQLRREAMMLVMRDKSLSKDEKAQKMEDIKLKYDDGTATSASTNGTNARMSPTASSGGLDVPAKSEESTPKPLTDDEAESLAVLLRPHLKLNNVSWVDADRDAENMLNCAIDSVNDGEHVDKILENLAEMEMKICDDEALENIGHSLEGFLKKSTQKKWREERAAREAAANKPLSLEEQLLNSENHVSIDLSAKKYGAKGRQEMAGLFGAGGGLKSRMGMYDETGKIVKSSKTEDGVVDERPKEKTADQLRRDELMAVMKDRSLSKDDKAKKMEEIKLKYDDGSSPKAEATTSAVTSSAPRSVAASGSSASPLDISAKSEESTTNPLKEDEVESLTASLKTHLRLNNVSCAFQAEADAEDFLNYAIDLVNDGEPLDKILEDLADMELEICDDEALKSIGDTLEDFLVQRNGGKKNWREERAAREAAAAKQRASLEAELLNSESHVSVDLSAKTNATKYRQEKEALFGGGNGGGLKSRMGMYDSSGKIVKSGKQEEKEVGKGPKGSSTDLIRREELMKVMRDKSLSKDEKAKKMEEIKQKYDGGTSSAAGTSTTSPMTEGSSFTSIDSEKIPTLPNGVNLSAKSASEKHHREMASLFGKGGGHAMSKNRTSYEQNLEHDRVSQKLGRSEAVEHKPAARKSKPANDAPPTLGAQRRAELQSIMKDSSLSKDERRQKMDEVKAKYAAKGGASRTSSLSSSISSSSSAGRRVDPSANTYSATPAKELDAIACKGTSVKDRQNMYSNQSTIAKGRDQQMGRDETSDQKTRRAEGFYSKRRNKTGVKVNTTGFALAENHMYGVYKQKKKQTSHEYGGRF